MADLSNLMAEWRKDMTAIGSFSDAAVREFGRVIRHYTEPHRHYHALPHLAALFRLLDMHAPYLGPGSAARLAVWWHDLIYDPTKSDNEERSADIATAALSDLGAGPALVAEVDRLIRMTKNHWTGPGAGHGDYFLDADIAILGAPSEVYDTYAAGVRQEYAWAPDAAYRAGRSKFLEAALAFPRLFRTDAFEDAYAAQALVNMRRELATLS